MIAPKPIDAHAEMTRGARWRRRAAAMASGLMLAASRPSIDVGFLSLVGLVPLLLALRGVRPRTAAGLGLIAGCGYYGVVVSWAWYFGAVALFPFVLVLAAYWSAAMAVLSWLRSRGWTSVWLVPAVWIVSEAAVARWPLGGFSWGELGYSTHDLGALRNLASFGGLSLVSAVVVLINAIIAEAIAGWHERTDTVRWLRPTASAAATVAVLTAGWSLGAPQMRATGSLRVAALQGNNINRDLTVNEIAARTLPNNHFGLAASLKSPQDLIVFPESGMHPERIDDVSIQARLRQVANDHDAYVIANGVHDRPDGRASNRSVVFDPEGQLVVTYDKRHLVPFGEYVPWRATLTKYISALDRIPRDFAPGARNGRFVVRRRLVSQVICFESAFGYAVRDDVDAGAEFIVVSTNNRSYRRSANSAQHIAIAQLRAAETGREIIHASVSGVSAHINDKGEVIQESQMFVNSVLQAAVTTRSGSTIYVRVGDWPLATALIALFALLTLTAARRFRGQRSTLAAPDAPGGP